MLVRDTYECVDDTTYPLVVETVCDTNSKTREDAKSRNGLVESMPLDPAAGSQQNNTNWHEEHNRKDHENSMKRRCPVWLGFLVVYQLGPDIRC